MRHGNRGRGDAARQDARRLPAGCEQGRYALIDLHELSVQARTLGGAGVALNRAGSKRGAIGGLERRSGGDVAARRASFGSIVEAARQDDRARLAGSPGRQGQRVDVRLAAETADPIDLARARTGPRIRPSDSADQEDASTTRHGGSTAPGVILQEDQ